MSYNILSFIISSVIVAIIPGLTVTLVISNTLRHGLSAGLLTVFGGIFAVFLMVIALSAGFQLIILKYSFVFRFIEIIGGLYLIWIGISMFLKKNDDKISNLVRKDNNYFFQGFFLMWSNPKTLIFLGAFLPQFVNEKSNISSQVILLGTVFTFIALISDSLYAIFINYINNFLVSQRQLVDRISGFSVLCVGLFLTIF